MTQTSQTPATISGTQNLDLFNPQVFDQVQRLAKMYVHSDLVPDMYKASDKTTESKAISNTIIAMNIAHRIGADLMMVMQNMTPIYGKPAWSSKFLIATVNTCGNFEPLKFKWENLGELKNYKYTEYETEWVAGQNGKKFKKITQKEKVFAGPVQNIQCVAFTTKKGSDEMLEGAPVTIEMALNEGWYTKNGSKWPTMTKQMAMYRAASFWTSVYAPELSMGMKTVEEVRDIEDAEFEDVTEKGNKKADQIIQENANKTTIDFDEEEPQGNEDDEAEEKENLQVMRFSNLDEARKILHDDFGILYPAMIREKIHDAALSVGVKIELTPPEEQAPGF